MRKILYSSYTKLSDNQEDLAFLIRLRFLEREHWSFGFPEFSKFEYTLDSSIIEKCGSSEQAYSYICDKCYTHGRCKTLRHLHKKGLIHLEERDIITGYCSPLFNEASAYLFLVFFSIISDELKIRINILDEGDLVLYPMFLKDNIGYVDKPLLEHLITRNENKEKTDYYREVLLTSDTEEISNNKFFPIKLRKKIKNFIDGNWNRDIDMNIYDGYPYKNKYIDEWYKALFDDEISDAQAVLSFLEDEINYENKEFFFEDEIE